MNDLSSSRNRPSTSEHRRSDGSLPIRNAQRSPGELHEIEQQHEAEVVLLSFSDNRRLLTIGI